MARGKLSDAKDWRNSWRKSDHGKAIFASKNTVSSCGTFLVLILHSSLISSLTLDCYTCGSLENQLYLYAQKSACEAELPE